jgi:hypothetical protein
MITRRLRSHRPIRQQGHTSQIRPLRPAHGAKCGCLTRCWPETVAGTDFQVLAAADWPAVAPDERGSTGPGFVSFLAAGIAACRQPVGMACRRAAAAVMPAAQGQCSARRSRRRRPLLARRPTTRRCTGAGAFGFVNPVWPHRSQRGPLGMVSIRQASARADHRRRDHADTRHRIGVADDELHRLAFAQRRVAPVDHVVLGEADRLGLGPAGDADRHWAGEGQEQRSDRPSICPSTCEDQGRRLDDLWCRPLLS